MESRRETRDQPADKKKRALWPSSSSPSPTFASPHSNNDWAQRPSVRPAKSGHAAKASASLPGFPTMVSAALRIWRTVRGSSRQSQRCPSMTLGICYYAKRDRLARDAAAAALIDRSIRREGARVLLRRRAQSSISGKIESHLSSRRGRMSVHLIRCGRSYDQAQVSVYRVIHGPA